MQGAQSIHCKVLKHFIKHCKVLKYFIKHINKKMLTITNNILFIIGVCIYI